MRLTEINAVARGQQQNLQAYKKKLQRVPALVKRMLPDLGKWIDANQQKNPNITADQLRDVAKQYVKKTLRFSEPPEELLTVPADVDVTDDAAITEYLKKALEAKYREDIYGSATADPANPQDTSGADQQQSTNNTQLNDRMKSQLDGLTPEQKQQLLQALQS